MPKILDTFPQQTRTPKSGLRIPQLRVLLVLSQAMGPITRSRIAERCGYQGSAAVVQAISSGYTSLLSLEYVREYEVNVDGVIELGVEITPSGRKALNHALRDGALPTLGDSEEESEVPDQA